MKYIYAIILLFFIAGIAYAWPNGFGKTRWSVDIFHTGGYGDTIDTSTPAEGDALLLETGDYLLLETGDKLLLE